MTDIKPCTVKGCKFAGYHHHATANNTSYREGAASQCLLNCGRQGGDSGWTATVAPRLTRKALNARIAALEAENADLHAEIADKKDRLARCEMPGPVVRVEPYPIEGAVSIHIDGNEFAGMVFGHRDGTFHGCAASVGIDDYYQTQDEAVAAIVSAWQAAA